MSDRFVTIARYNDLVEPQIAKGILDQHGILCHLIGENHARAESLAIIALGGIQLRVLQEDAEAALQLLDTGKTPLSSDACPVCGQHEVVRGYSVGLAIFLELLPLPRKWLTSRRKCLSCNHRWRKAVEPPATG